MGDATNLVLILAGELLKRSEHLLTMGLHPSDVILGYEMALEKGRQELECESAHNIYDYMLTDFSNGRFHSITYSPPYRFRARCRYCSFDRFQAARLRETPQYTCCRGRFGRHAKEPKRL